MSIRAVTPMMLVASIVGCSRTDVYSGADALVAGGDAGGWVEIAGSATAGGISAHADDATCVGVIVDSQGRIYVTWADANVGSRQIYLRRYASGAWSSLAGSGDGGGVSQGTALAGGTTCPSGIDIDSTDRVYLAWQEFTGTNQSVYLKVWDDVAWTELGGSATGEGISDGWGTYSWWPSVVVINGGEPWVSYTSGSNAYVERWTTSWAGVAGSDVFPGLSGVDGNAVVVTLTRDGSGGVIAAWTEQAGATADIHVASSTGSAWTGVGGGVGTSTSSVPRLAVMARGAVPFVSWSDADEPADQLRVARFTSGAWLELPIVSAAGGQRSAMAIDSSGNPVLVFSRLDGATWKVHGARWDGAAWVSLDGASGSISATTRDATWPAVAVTPTNEIVVVWLQDVGNARTEIYGRRLTF